jgi:hypothetical protein
MAATVILTVVAFVTVVVAWFAGLVGRRDAVILDSRGAFMCVSIRVDWLVLEELEEEGDLGDSMG